MADFAHSSVTQGKACNKMQKSLLMTVILFQFSLNERAWRGAPFNQAMAPTYLISYPISENYHINDVSKASTPSPLLRPWARSLHRPSANPLRRPALMNNQQRTWIMRLKVRVQPIYYRPSRAGWTPGVAPDATGEEGGQAYCMLECKWGILYEMFLRFEILL